MSRIQSSETYTVPPTNNVYTALVAIAMVAVILAIITVIMRADIVFDKGLFS